MSPSTVLHLDLIAGKFEPASSAANLDGLFQAVRVDPLGKNLVIYFHGGLVGRTEALRSAQEVLAPAFQDARACPVFIIWNSDLLTTLTHRWTGIVQSKAFWRLVRRLSQFVAGAFFGELGGRGDDKLELPSLRDVPDDRSAESLDRYWRNFEAQFTPNAIRGLNETQQEQVQDELAHDSQLLRDIEDGMSSGSPFSREVLDALASERGERGDRVGVLTLASIGWRGWQIVQRVIERRRTGRHHGWHDTIVQEILRGIYLDNLGTAVWDALKQDAKDAFADDPAVWAGTAFLNALARLWQEGQRVTLIGHSTGALFIGEFLKAADTILPAGCQFNVVFLAPACTFTFLTEQLPTFQKRVRGIRLFGLKDERECSYWEVPLLARGSLLYIVSGLLEKEADTPLVGMQRYYLGKPPYDIAELKLAREYLQGNAVWAEADEGAGRRSNALTHGGMTEERCTLESLQDILRGGL
jgi:hypothetical protein